MSYTQPGIARRANRVLTLRRKGKALEYTVADTKSHTTMEAALPEALGPVTAEESRLLGAHPEQGA